MAFPSEQPAPVPDREFRLAPDLRRCCWYCIVGGLLLTPLFLLVALYVQKRGVLETGTLGLVFVLISLSFGLPLRWRLRVDSSGLSRRWFRGWDHWKWDDIASGKIQKRYPCQLVDQSRPWGKRTLNLGLLGTEDIRTAFAFINQHYSLPPAPEISDALSLKLGFGKRVTFDPRGIHLVIDNKTHDYAWADVEEILVVRWEPKCRGFHRLLVFLPDREIELKVLSADSDATTSWRGASAEVINEFLHRSEASARIEVAIVGEPPKSLRRINRELREAKKNVVSLTIVATFCIAVWMTFLVMCAIENQFFEGIFSSLVLASLFVPVLGAGFFMQRSRVAKLKKLARLASQRKNELL
ncbi:MAG: hypothetical protein KDA83_13360 [Planctomycetales bacterium]|nr:hypothetical protein [Planctomycetales bacterium]